MKWSPSEIVLAAVATALVVAPLSHAADQLVAGKKLVIRNNATNPNRNKVVIIMRDGVIAKQPGGGTGDPTIHGGSVRIVGVGGAVALPVPGPNATDGEWIQSLRLFKYRRGDGIVGDACRVVIVRDSRIVKAVCRGDDVDYDVDAGVNVAIDVVVSTGDESYCTRFGSAAPEGCLVVRDGSDGRRYIAKNCTGAPVACPASPSGAFLEVANPF